MPRSSLRRSTRREAPTSYNDDDEEEDPNEANTQEETLSKNSTTSSRQEKMQQDIDELAEEYDVAAPGRSSSGHLKRKVPKAQWKARTRKRKLLEKADEEVAAVDSSYDHHHRHHHNDEAAPAGQPRQRSRGSRVAFEEQLIQESRVFPSSKNTRKQKGQDTISSEEDQQKPAAKDSSSKTSEDLEDEDEDFEDDEDEDDEMVDDDDEEEEDVEDYDDDAAEEDEEVEGVDKERASKGASGGRRKKRKMGPRASGRRRMFRLRNFQSQRMAQRHGEALAAHARGQPREAIGLLKLVAKDAPSAPQIYSSLGMVYEDMLKESRKRGGTSSRTEVNDTSAVPSATQTDQTSKSSNILEGSIPDPALAEQLDLAQKAYGSYHVAAILCKRDYMLWVRAADAGSEVVRTLEQAILLPELTPEVVVYNRSEKKRWQSEILRDLRAADKLHPPGIDIPCKLAAMHIEVGNLSEALTILTDLKNRRKDHPDRLGRSEFQSSYKAWLLYGDLMLRVGHECIQWNRDVRSNDNYMFRRWLRKYAQVFDWQERRLQALSLALEAGAGTKSTERFIHWMRDRAYKNHPNISADNTTVVDDSNRDGSRAQLESEKQLLLAKNLSEMEAFDRTTNDMDLTSNSEAAKDRQVSRDELLKAQEDAAATLNGEYDGGEKQSQSEKEDDEMMTDYHDSMPISASCQEVCRIASELMKHLHGLEFFEGARLVGESVSDYLKERATKHDRRSAASKRVQEWQEKMSQPSFLFASYEEESEDEFDEGGESSPFLSDDEDLDKEDGSQVLASLRKGILPPELRVLYGLALIGEGGRNFLARKCLEAIDDLEQESSSWLISGERETEASGEPLWYLFHRAMTEPLGCTAAYAFLADVLRKTKKEQEWSVHFSSWFRKHLATLDSVGLKAQLMGLREDVSPFVNFRKNQLLKIVLAACSFDIDAAESPAQPNSVNSEPAITDEAERVKIAIAAMKSLSEVLHLMWRVDSDGSIPSICAEVIKVCSRCYRWLAKEAKARLSYYQLHTVLGYVKTFLSFLCGTTTIIPDFTSSDEIEMLKDQEWNSLPINTTWQAPEYRDISLRVYNLTVACNVSLFSGWEPEEFTFRLLRRRHGHKHFGVHLRERRVTGYLNSRMEGEIARQWCEVRKLLPAFPDVKFDERVNAIKESEWYKTEVEDRKTTLEGTNIARYGEDSAEELYLAFSSLCLHLASSEKKPMTINRLLHTSLSILLPVSQFCVDDRLWDSDIGEAASSLSGFDEWKLLNRMDLDDVMDQVTNKHKRRRKSEKVIERKVQEWISGTEKPTLQSFVSLPTNEMRRLWLQGSEPSSKDEKDAAVEIMKKVDTSIEKLRACYTESAVEKASLQISVALLELASLPGCFDPFRCLQQAAIFASQACKAGNSDMAYRALLPEKTECTPLQALVILGRADCLHSVYFPNEAAYLCSYVALICRLHRENEDSDEATNTTTGLLEWNIQWKIVAIYAYNVSVMIRTTVSTVLDKQQQKSFLSMWEYDVVEELERGRSDGWVWKRSLFGTTGGGGLVPHDDENLVDDFEADEAENSLGEQDNESDDNEEDNEEDEDNESDDEDGDDDHDDDHDEKMEARHEEFVETDEDPTTTTTFPFEFPLPNIPIPNFAARSNHGTNGQYEDDEIVMVSV